MLNQMKKVEWSSPLAVGEDGIDEQHSKFLNIINCGIDAAENNKPALVQQSLNELIEYSKYHFKHERELMQEHQYPEMSMHLGAHGDFLEKVIDLNEKFQRQEIIVNELLNFMQSWLLLHIQDTDQKLGKYLRMKKKL